jgi:hypothetical protein
MVFSTARGAPARRRPSSDHDFAARQQQGARMVVTWCVQLIHLAPGVHCGVRVVDVGGMRRSLCAPDNGHGAIRQEDDVDICAGTSIGNGADRAPAGRQRGEIDLSARIGRSLPAGPDPLASAFPKIPERSPRQPLRMRGSAESDRAARVDRRHPYAAGTQTRAGPGCEPARFIAAEYQSVFDLTVAVAHGVIHRAPSSHRCRAR